jgi:hypothetical protein
MFSDNWKSRDMAEVLNRTDVAVGGTISNRSYFDNVVILHNSKLTSCAFEIGLESTQTYSLYAPFILYDQEVHSKWRDSECFKIVFML